MTPILRKLFNVIFMIGKRRGKNRDRNAHHFEIKAFINARRALKEKDFKMLAEPFK